MRPSGAAGAARATARIRAAVTGTGLMTQQKATILIVDDEADVCEVLDEYFVAHGYETLCAQSAAAAREIATKRMIDLALVDISMPGEDGLSLARHLRERYAHVAIIILTSAGSVID